MKNHPEFLPSRKKMTINILVYFCYAFYVLKYVKLYKKFKVISKLLNKNPTH